MFHAIAREVVLLVGLLALYQIVFKLSRWRSTLMRLVIPRTRVVVYLGLCFFSLWRILTHVPAAHWKPLVVDLAQGLLFLCVSIFFIELVHMCVFDYLLAYRQKIDVPYIFRDLIRATLYVIVVILLFRFVYNIDVTSLVAASGLLAIMLGFALQTVMSDFFAGMSMQVTRPYSLGDWIRVGEKEGKVEHIDWRSTVLRTLYDDFLVIPNSKLAHDPIYNFSQPTPMHLHHIIVGTHYRHAPAEVQRIVREAVATVEHVHHERGCTVMLEGFDDSSLRWKVKFWISEFGRYPHIESEVRSRIWYAFQREGIEIPYPQRTVTMLSEASDGLQATAFHLFSRIDWLSALTTRERESLASKVRLVRYGPDEVIVRQGDPGESLFIIRHGTVEIRARHSDGQVFMRKTLSAGDFFGEISALTGEPRTADVVALEDASLLVLHKEALRKIVVDDAELISRLLTRRQELTQQKEDSMVQVPAAADAGDDRAHAHSLELFKKIRDFFAF